MDTVLVAQEVGTVVGAVGALVAREAQRGGRGDAVEVVGGPPGERTGREEGGRRWGRRRGDRGGQTRCRPL